MMRHLIRLMWNRKRQNGLLVAEMFVTFLLVVAVAVVVAHFGSNALRPIGFSYQDVWAVEVQRAAAPGGDEERAKEAARETFRHIVAELRAQPAAEAVASSFMAPYQWYSWSDPLLVEGKPSMSISRNRADDAFAGVLSMPVVHGRWFSREDDASWSGGWEPVVVNRQLARDIFGREDVAGETIPEVPPPGGREGDGRAPRPKRIVGVIDEFRQHGELSMPWPLMFHRGTLDAPAADLALPDVLEVRVRPGTTAEFEETLLDRLSVLAPDWTFRVRPIVTMREDVLRDNIVPLTIVTTAAGAMLLMVALGLTGVVWQSVTTRTKEFGLRRAQGAAARDIGRQVIAELVVTVSFAIVAGCVLLLQIPLLPLPPDLAVVPRPVFVAGVLAAIVAVYSVTMLCAWYPSRLATQIAPAGALRDE